MSYIIIGLALVAVWHFVYELVFAPLFRYEARAEVFELRRDLAGLRQKGVHIEDTPFKIFRESLVNLEQLVFRLEVMLLVRYRAKISANPDLRLSVEKRIREIKAACDRSPEFNQLELRATELALRSLRINTSGWLVYVVPIGLTFSMLGKLKRGILRILSTPEPTIERLSPQLCGVSN